MNRTSMFTLVLTTIALSGCSKALTESSASGVIQKWVDAQGGGTVNVSAGELTNRLGTEMPSTWSAAGVQRLIKQGYIEEKTVSVAYPNLSGHYTATREERIGFSLNVFVDTFDLQTNSGTRPPRVEGSFRSCFFSDCTVGGPVSGVVSRNGPSTLTLSFQGKDLATDRILNYSHTLVVALERGQMSTLVGRYTDNLVSPQASAIRANRLGPSPPDIQQKIKLCKRPSANNPMEHG